VLELYLFDTEQYLLKQPAFDLVIQVFLSEVNLWSPPFTQIPVCDFNSHSHLCLTTESRTQEAGTRVSSVEEEKVPNIDSSFCFTSLSWSLGGLFFVLQSYGGQPNGVTPGFNPGQEEGCDRSGDTY